jgi:hypothetical protein
MNTYLAGPMRGLPLYNLHAFARGAYILRDLGHTVFNPFEYDLAFCKLRPDLTLDLQNFDLGEAMRRDLEFIVSANCDSISLLPGWRDSDGAVVETLAAFNCGRNLYEFDDSISEILYIPPNFFRWTAQISVRGD